MELSVPAAEPGPAAPPGKLWENHCGSRSPCSQASDFPPSEHSTQGCNPCQHPTPPPRGEGGLSVSVWEAVGVKQAAQVHQAIQKLLSAYPSHAAHAA